MTTYEIDVHDGTTESVEATTFRIAEGHYIFTARGSHDERAVFAIPTSRVLLVRALKAN